MPVNLPLRFGVKAIGVISLKHVQVSRGEIRNLNIAHHRGTEYTEKGIMNHLKTRIVSGPSGLEALKYSGLTAHSLHSFENVFTTPVKYVTERKVEESFAATVDMAEL